MLIHFARWRIDAASLIVGIGQIRPSLVVKWFAKPRHVSQMIR
jgi:hypothetical protein